MIMAIMGWLFTRVLLEPVVMKGWDRYGGTAAWGEDATRSRATWDSVACRLRAPLAKDDPSPARGGPWRQTAGAGRWRTAPAGNWRGTADAGVNKAPVRYFGGPRG